MTFGEYLRYFLLLIFFPSSLKIMEWRMLRLLNRDRKRHGLKPVRMQEDLREVARKHSLDMAQKEYFDHVNVKAQTPADRLKMSGVTDVVSGENLAKVGGYKNPTQFAEAGLMNSPGHRANILNKSYNTIGVGVILSKEKIYYFTQNFAKRDLIFKNVFLKNVWLRRGLKLNGTVFSDVESILYQVRIPKSEKVITEGKYKVHNNSFKFSIKFKSTDRYEIYLFVRHKGKDAYVLTSSFIVRVKKWLFF